MNIRKLPLRTMAVRDHARQARPDDTRRFSFRLLQRTRKFGAEISDAASYLQHLLQRLQDLSGMRVAEFRALKGKSLRAHRHVWIQTTEAGGVPDLPPPWTGLPAWQFQLTANKHGRVHGYLVDEVFYVVWLDPEHRLYQ